MFRVWNKNLFLKNVCLITLLVCVVSVLTGCDERVRKKFIRKKNTDKEKTLDVVYAPVDYSPEYYDAYTEYKQRYIYWRSWDNELMYAFKRDDSQKRKKYLVQQAENVLLDMRKWLNGEQQQELDVLLAKMDEVQEDLEKPEQLQSSNRIHKDLQHIAKLVRLNFSPEVLSEYLNSF